MILRKYISVGIYGAIFLSLSVPFALAQNRKGLIVDGVNFENILIGKTTMKEVKAKYGENYETNKNGDYSVEIIYKTLGLTFYACAADPNKEIFDIVFESPAAIKTSKGIILGKSTLGDVYRIYKSPGEKTYSDSDQPGMFFFVKTDDSSDAYEPLIPEPDSKEEKVHKAKIIKRIELVELSGSRQCDAMFPPKDDK